MDLLDDYCNGDGKDTVVSNGKCGGTVELKYNVDPKKDKMPEILIVTIDKMTCADGLDSLNKFTTKFEFCVDGKKMADYLLAAIIFMDSNHYRSIILDTVECGDMNIIYDGMGLGGRGSKRLGWIKHSTPFSTFNGMMRYKVLEMWYVKNDMSHEIEHHDSLSELHTKLNSSSDWKDAISLTETSWLYGNISRACAELQLHPPVLEKFECYSENTEISLNCRMILKHSKCHLI